MLDELEPSEREAFKRAWFDTGMLMLRPSVHARALDALEEANSERQAAPEPIPESTTEVNEDEQTEELPW